MTKDETLKLALEALEELTDTEQTHAALERGDAAIAAIKEALAQPEYRAVKTYHEGKPVYVTQQEPVAWRNAAIRLGEELSSVGPVGYYDMTAAQWLDWAMAQEPRGKYSLTQPEQEPVAWITKTGNVWKTKADETDTPLYTTPPQRKPLNGVLVPLNVLEAAEESLGNFCSDHGWGDKDMQNMDNLSAYIAQHKAAHGIKE